MERGGAPTRLVALHHPDPGAHVLQPPCDVQRDPAAARHEDAGVVWAERCVRRECLLPSSMRCIQCCFKAMQRATPHDFKVLSVSKSPPGLDVVHVEQHEAETSVGSPLHAER